MSGFTPYFMTNDEWYEYVEGAELEYGTNYLLTEKGKSIPEVVESWNEFIKDDKPTLSL